MKKVKIKFIKEYLTYSGEMLTTSQNAEKLINKGVAELVEEVEKPKRGRKPNNKKELKDSIETK